MTELIHRNTSTYIKLEGTTNDNYTKQMSQCSWDFRTSEYSAQKSSDWTQNKPIPRPSTPKTSCSFYLEVRVDKDYAKQSELI
jgi:hypothetical protein